MVRVPSTVSGLDRVVLGASSISLVEGERGWLVYRGFDVAELVRSASYESVVHLLLFGEPPADDPSREWSRALAQRRTIPVEWARLIDAAGPLGPPMDALRTIVSRTGDGQVGYPPTVEQGMALVARAPTLLAHAVRRARGSDPLAPREELGHVENYLYLLEGRRPAPERVRALERYFLLLADHGMNASTFALRVVLSTQADLAAGATAALAALKGPAHGGAPAKVLEMLDAIGSPEEAGPWIAAALARRERLYGFGHRAYKVEDPRSILLKEIAREIAPPDRFRLAESVESAGLAALRAAKPKERLSTNVEFYAAVVLEAVGLPTDLFTPTFALARTAGWAAHALEQARGNRLIRPDVRYTGPARGRRWPERSDGADPRPWRAGT